MACLNCEVKPVIKLTAGPKLCKNCFIKYFEKKVIKTISKYKLLDKEDNIAVAVSSGKDSFALLYILNKIAEKNRNLDLKAIAIDEGIEGYRDLTLLEKYCKENNIELHVTSFKKEFGLSLDEAIKKLDVKPCSICGVFRRYLLNKKARELNVKKLATGHNLDDEAQSIMMNNIKGNLERSSRLGPITGTVKDKRFIPRIKPLFFMTEKETATYAHLRGFPIKFSECPNAYGLRRDIMDMLNDLENKHPGTKQAVINSFLDILPILKEKYSDREIKICINCGEPSASETCKSCQILNKLKAIN